MIQPNKNLILMALLGNLALSAILFCGFYFLPLPQLFPCTHPLVENFILAICVALIVEYFIFKKYKTDSYFWILVLDIILILAAFWLGTYSISPLGFSSGRISMAQGFVLTRSMRPDMKIASGETINAVGGSPIAIRAIMLPFNRHCFWVSTKGGALDDSGNCDIVFMPPSDSTYDLLKVLIQPACHLPEIQENIKVIILP